MNQPLKILFDENIGRPLVGAIASLLAFYKPAPQVFHILDLYGQGKPDDEWVPRISRDGYTVLSCDRGRWYGGAKLPDVCKAHCVTHIILKGALLSKPQFEKARAIIVAWPGIVGVATAPKGSRFTLRLNSAGTPVVV